MASAQSVPQPQNGADNNDENIEIVNDQEIRNLVKNVSKAIKEFVAGTTGRKKEKIDRQEEADDEGFSWLYRCMDVADQVIMLYEEEARNFVTKKWETLLGEVLTITGLASRLYLFGYLEWAYMLLDDPENLFADELSRVKKYHEEVKKQRKIISGLVDEANDILDEMLKSEGIDKVKKQQFDNAVRKARLEINSCRGRLTVAEEIIVEIDTKLRYKKWFSRSVRVTGWAASSFYFYQKYRVSTIPFSLFVASSVAAAGVAGLSLFLPNTCAFDKEFTKATRDHHGVRKEINDLLASIESLEGERDRY